MAFLFPRFCNKHTEDYSSPFLRDRVFGIHWNIKTITVALPTTKMNSIQSDVAKILQNKTICLKALSQLLGKLLATKPAVFRAFLHYRALQHLKISMMRSGQKVTTIPPEAQKDLTWYTHNCQCTPAPLLFRRRQSVVIESDALLKGWGVNCEGMRTSGVWNVNEAQCYINFLELKAAYLAIQCFLKERSEVNVLLRLDNHTAVAYLNHIGGIYDLSMLSSSQDMGVVPSTGDNDPCRISAWCKKCSSRLGVASPQ